VVPTNKVSRRQFLKLAGALGGAAVLLPACSAPAQPAAPAAPAATAAPAAPAATEAPAATAAPAATEAPAPTAAPAASTKAVTLRYRTWHTREGAPGDDAWYNWLTENFKTVNPNAKIEYEFVGWGNDYIQKVLADAAAGTPPDLLHSSIVWARDFYDRGVISELDSYIAVTPELAADKFIGDATNEYRSKDGKYYGVPWEGPDSAIYAINQDLAEKAGVDPTGKAIKTWDDLLQAAKKMTKMNGSEMEIAGLLGQDHRYIEYFNGLLTSNGGSIATDNFTKPNFNNEKGQQVMEWSLQLLKEVSFPISPDRQDSQLFMSGKAAMMQAGTWSTAEFANAPEGFRYEFFIFPQGPQGDGKHASTTWSNMFLIPKKVADPDAAFALMKFCTTPPGVLQRFKLSARTTPLKAIFESDTWNEVVAKNPQKKITIPAAEAGSTYPFFPFFTEANDAIGVELNKVMTGQADVKAGLAAAEAAVNEVIKRRAAGQS
jgi:multiple sugar transport system substrate-binding protein